jgi:hypothetical protein
MSLKNTISIASAMIGYQYPFQTKRFYHHVNLEQRVSYNRVLSKKKTQSTLTSFTRR